MLLVATLRYLSDDPVARFGHGIRLVRPPNLLHKKKQNARHKGSSLGVGHKARALLAAFSRSTPKTHSQMAEVTVPGVGTAHGTVEGNTRVFKGEGHPTRPPHTSPAPQPHPGNPTPSCCCSAGLPYAQAARFEDAQQPVQWPASGFDATGTSPVMAAYQGCAA